MEIESDHKPLEAIIRKPIHSATPRIQLMLMRLMRYKLTLKYVPGTRMYIADTLSRAYTPNDAGSSSHKDDEFRRIHIITDRYPATKERLEIMRVETLRDRTLVKLRARLRHGWPAHRSSTHSDLQPFWSFRDEIHEENDLLFWGERLIIRSSQGKELLHKLPEGHPGASKCKARASLSMYWP